MSSTYLGLKWTTSRAHDTYGYNVVTLTDQRTGKRYRAMGGGYDMVGTVFGQWLEDAHTDKLSAWADKQGVDDTNSMSDYYSPVRDFYGAVRYRGGSVRLDGAAGIDCMIRIVRALGLEIERTYKPSGPNRGETTGWFVTEAGA